MTATASLTDSTLDSLVIASEFTAVAMQRRKPLWETQSTMCQSERPPLPYYPSQTSSAFINDDNPTMQYVIFS